MPYSVSPRRKLTIVGLNPSWNLRTRMPTRFAARKWPSSCTNTSTPSTNRNEITVVTTGASSGFQLYPAGCFPRKLPGPLVHGAHGGDRGHLGRRVRIHGALDDLGDRRKAQAPLEKPRHGHLVGGVEHDGQAPVGIERTVRQTQAGKRDG